MPDAGTLAYLYTMDNYNYVYDSHPLGVFFKKPGDVYIICDGTRCVTYTRTNSDDFLGGAITAQQSGSGGGGGGGTFGTVIVGVRPVYRTTQTCTPSGCTTQQILVGYEFIYGPGTITTRER